MRKGGSDGFTKTANKKGKAKINSGSRGDGADHIDCFDRRTYDFFEKIFSVEGGN